MLLECLLFVNKCFNIYGNENRLNCQLRDWLADVVVRTTCRLKSKGQADERPCLGYHWLWHRYVLRQVTQQFKRTQLSKAHKTNECANNSTCSVYIHDTTI